MNRKNLLITGFLLMAAGVALGAFGAHAMKDRLAVTGRAETYELAIRYLMIHALAVVLLSYWAETYPRLKVSATLLIVGIFFFSGSLMILAISNEGRWGAVAPIGGTALILGWLSAAWAIWKS